MNAEIVIIWCYLLILQNGFIVFQMTLKNFWELYELARNYGLSELFLFGGVLMIYNKEMENYLNQVATNSKLSEPSDIKDLNILQGTNSTGEPFFYLEHNCCNVSNKSTINFTGEDLTQLEWDCNEIYINNSEDSICLLQTGLFTVKLIKAILETKYSSHAFDIIMSFDDGEELNVLPSVTVRFYTIRNNNPFISHDKLHLEEFNQPVLIESVS